MTTELAANALMTEKDFYAMYKLVDSTFDEDDADRDEFVIRSINSLSTIFESFCNRRLKARGYSYVSNESDVNYIYDVDYSIFDGPNGYNFYFPTYPVASITKILISDVEISPSTNYEAVDGYILYNKKGLLVFEQGFDCGYYKNVKIKWRGGYESSSVEMSELQYLMFVAMKTIINAPDNPMLQSETIGSYQYQNFSSFVTNSLRSMAPEVYANLGRYRREVIG